MSVIWGIPYLLIKVAVDEVSPVTRGLRPLRRRRRDPAAVDDRDGASCARRCGTGGRCCCSPCWRWPAPWLLLSYAETSLSSSLTGLLVATVPFVAALAARLAGEDERLTPVRLLGMGIGVVGIARAAGPRRRRRAAAAAARGRRSSSSATRPAPGRSAARCPRCPGWRPARSRCSSPPSSTRRSPSRGSDELADASAPALLSLVALGAICTALALALFFALIREVGPAAGAGHHLRQPGGRGAARRPAAR